MTNGMWRRGKCQHIVLASNADAYNAGMQVGAPPPVTAPATKASLTKQHENINPASRGHHHGGGLVGQESPERLMRHGSRKVIALENIAAPPFQEVHLRRSFHTFSDH